MIIWISSYPKSGNTWVRSIVSSIMFSKDGLFNFDLIKKIPQFPRRKYFKDFTNDYHNINEIKKYWIFAQEKINLNNEINFFKTHQLNCKIDNYHFTNKECSAGAIYVVRDPRNLINSISNHFNKTEEGAKKFLISKSLIGVSKESNKEHDIATVLGTWGEHYQFWTKNTENLLLIKYENLIKNPLLELNRIIDFIKKFAYFEMSKKKKENIIKSTSFQNLKKLELEGKFTENVYDRNSQKINFFNKGPNNIWKDNLNIHIQEEIEKKFKTEMKELGYI